MGINRMSDVRNTPSGEAGMLMSSSSFVLRSIYLASHPVASLASNFVNFALAHVHVLAHVVLDRATVD